MKKSKNQSSGGSEPDIPAAILERLRQAFQKSASPELPCPEPEQVISCALEELEAAAAQKVQAHLLTCRDCLDLFLDVRLARAEAESPAELTGAPREAPQKAGWLATISSKVRETMQILVKPRKLIPALAAVSLVVLVFILGREDRPGVLPPADLALDRQAAPSTAPSAAPFQEPSAAPPSPELPGRGLLASKRKFETAAPALEKSVAATDTLSASRPGRLDFAEVPAPAGGTRLSYRSDRDAFAYLLRLDSSGKINLLFSGKLEGGKNYFYPAQSHLPKPDAAITDQTKVYLVASKKPLGDLETKIQGLEHRDVKQIQSLFPGATIRSLAVTLP
jgi:hypothetical protein